MVKSDTDNLSAKLTVGFNQKYFVVKDEAESNPYNYFWIVIKDGKESDPSAANNITAEYLNDVSAKIYVNNPDPTGGVIIG